MKVYPCQCPEGHYVTGYPQTELDVTKAEAAWLVATKAFSYDAAGLHEKWSPHESATWPPPDAEPTQTEAPPEGGVSDSGS